MTAERTESIVRDAYDASYDAITLPEPPVELRSALEAGSAVAWSEPLTIRTYEAGEPSRVPDVSRPPRLPGLEWQGLPDPVHRERRRTRPPAYVAGRPPRERIRASRRAARARRPHPHRLRQDHGLRLLLPEQRHQAGARRPRRAVDQRRRRVQLAAASPAGNLPARRDRDRARRRRLASPCGATTTTRSPACRRSTASGCAPDSSVIELVVRLHNRTDERQTFLWWANVAARVHDDYQSFFPEDVRYVADHARRALTAFPAADRPYYGVDYPALAAETPGADRIDWYRNIPVPTSYMIVDSQQDFFGGYDHAAGAGFVHWAERRLSPGQEAVDVGRRALRARMGCAADRRRRSVRRAHGRCLHRQSARLQLASPGRDEGLLAVLVPDPRDRRRAPGDAGRCRPCRARRRASPPDSPSPVAQPAAVLRILRDGDRRRESHRRPCARHPSRPRGERRRGRRHRGRAARPDGSASSSAGRRPSSTTRSRGWPTSRRRRTRSTPSRSCTSRVCT